MVDFNVGDRVRTQSEEIAGRIVGAFTGSGDLDPWPLVRVTHAPRWPTMVGIDATWSPDDLVHID